MKQGRFITIEGTEGVGKSTNIAFIQTFLEDRGVTLEVTREPGGTPLAEELREALLKKREETVDATAELLMMFAARAQHLNTRILPALKAGHWVLCDRFTDATYAYQGYGRGLSLDVITGLEQIVQNGLQPDLTVLLDIEVSTGLKRASERAELDRFESEKTDFFEKVRRGYHARAQQRPDQFAVIDASQSLEHVQRDIAKMLAEKCGSWFSV